VAQAQLGVHAPGSVDPAGACMDLPRTTRPEETHQRAQPDAARAHR